MPNTFDLLMFNMSTYAEWQRQGIENRNYHLLQAFRKDPRVGKILAVDYLPVTLKRALRNWAEGIAWPLPGAHRLRLRLTSALAKADDRLFVSSAIASAWSEAQACRTIRQHAQRVGLGNVVLWSCFPLLTGYLGQFGEQLTAFDLVDNWAVHPNYRRFKEKLLVNYQTIAKRADVITTVGQEGRTLLGRPDAVWVPNGVDLGHYQQEFRLLNRDIADLPHPIIGYIGTIQQRIDLPLLTYVAEHNPQCTFALVGPTNRRWWKEYLRLDVGGDLPLRQLRKLPNVVFLGRKSYAEAPMYIQQFDVGIIPHRPDEFLRYTDPMKLHQYMAAGKPVVSTAGAGVEAYGNLVHVTNDPERFSQYIRRALAEDNAGLRQRRLEAAQANTWEARGKVILDLIERKLDERRT